MYGLIFNTVKEVVVENFDLQKWEEILDSCDTKESFFISTEVYDDALMYRLLAVAEQKLKFSQQEILEMIGEHWIASTTNTKYAALIKAGGSDLKSFICNLPFLHSRIILLYPDIQTFNFEVLDQTKNQLELVYTSERKMLEYFLMGTLKGLAKMYNESVEFKILAKEMNGTVQHTKIMINWTK